MIGFIIGTGRCGTTMVAQALNAHSNICVPHELQILFEYSNNGTRLFEIFKTRKNETFVAEDFINAIQGMCPHKFDEYFDYKSFFMNQKYPILSLKELANSLYAEIAKSYSKALFVEQTPWYGQRLDILNELFPAAKYIHMVRDGRDVSISFARTPWWNKDANLNLLRWDTEVKYIIGESKRILNQNQMLQIRYEDYVIRPEFELRKICEHLEVDFEFSMLDSKNYIDYEAYKRPSINLNNVSSNAFLDWTKTKRDTTFKGSLYAWKNQHEIDFSIIPKHIVQTLQSLNYDIHNYGKGSL
jgi:Sulfotransferase family